MPNRYTYTAEQLAAAKAKLIAKFEAQDREDMAYFRETGTFRRVGRSV